MGLCGNFTKTGLEENKILKHQRANSQESLASYHDFNERTQECTLSITLSYSFERSTREQFL